MRALTYPKDGAVAVFGGTGGAGSAICTAFAEAGCRVAFTYLSNASKARELEQELKAQGARGYLLDLASVEHTAEVVETMQADFGAIHTVVYAAGPAWEVLPIADVAPDEFRRVVQAELLGFFNIVHATMPALRRNAGTVIACTTYGNARVLPMDGQSASPKAGIDSLVRQIAWEEAPHGVRANSVALGWMNFGLGEIGGGERSMLKGEAGIQAAELMGQRIPLGRRPGTGGELADAVLFMASQQASYITGQYLAVDGGASL